MKKIIFFTSVFSFVATTYSFAMWNGRDDESPAISSAQTPKTVASTSRPYIDAVLEETRIVAEAWHDYNTSWKHYTLTGLWDKNSSKKPDTPAERIHFFGARNYVTSKGKTPKHCVSLEELQRACQADYDFSEDFLKALSERKKYVIDALYCLSRLREHTLGSFNSKHTNPECELVWLSSLQESLKPLASEHVIAFAKGVCSHSTVEQERMVLNVRRLFDSFIPQQSLEGCEKWRDDFETERESHSALCPLVEKFRLTDAVPGKVQNAINLEMTLHEALIILSVPRSFLDESPIQKSLKIYSESRKTTPPPTTLFIGFTCLRDVPFFVKTYCEEISPALHAIGRLNDFVKKWRSPVVSEKDKCCTKKAEITRQQDSKEIERLGKSLQVLEPAKKERTPKNYKRNLAEPLTTSSKASTYAEETRLGTQVQARHTASEAGSSSAETQAVKSLQEENLSATSTSTKDKLLSQTQTVEKLPQTNASLTTTQTSIAEALSIVREASVAATSAGVASDFESVQMVISHEGSAPRYEDFLSQLQRDFGQYLEIKKENPVFVTVRLPRSTAMVAFDVPHGPALEKRWPQWRCQCKILFQKLGLIK